MKHYTQDKSEVMKPIFSLSGIWISVALLATVGTILGPKNLVWADTILCKGSADCGGTDQVDNMFGDDASNSIFAFGDDDVITGKDGNDHLFGDVGNDVISGGKGSDEIIAGAGADKLAGGEGNDKIIQFAVTLELVSDGSKDIIDCGPGIDEAWINVSVDHDTASGCEIVHQG